MKLQPLLSEYLLENRSLPLQGAGRLLIKEKTAVVKGDDSTILPPSVSLKFVNEKPAPEEEEKLVFFIGSRLCISQEQALKLLREEGNLQNAFSKSETLDWPVFGGFQRQEDGTLSFMSADELNNYLPVITLKQNRPQADAEAVVETTTPGALAESVYELEVPPQKDNWWVWAIVILVVSLALILFRYL